MLNVNDKYIELYSEYKTYRVYSRCNMFNINYKYVKLYT